MKRDDTDALRARIEALEAVLAEAYQFAGTVGAPKRVLDALDAAANGRPAQRSFLPVQLEECSEVATLLKLIPADVEAPARGRARTNLAAILGRAGGQVRSRVKAASSRANGAKGGRPRKKLATPDDPR